MTTTLPIDHEFPTPGKLFAERYRITRLIGTGGYSRVYGAQDSSGQTVAVKILVLQGKAGRASREIVEKRFYREARFLARLRGANTLRVHDYGRTSDGQLFMVSELVDGTDLKTLIGTQGPLPESRARRIFAQMLQGLLEVHNEGFLHRDIKPSNIMVFDRGSERDCVKLLDFGIAKGVTIGVNDDTALTMAGFVIGTPGYMSPEQALGRPVDTSSDVFSAALVAYEMLTGRSPYLGLSLEQMQRRLMSGLRLPATLQLDPEFDRVLHRALAIDPEDRYPSTAEALSDLGIQTTTLELPAIPEPERPTNVLSFPLQFDATGSTTIDTLLDPETGQTAAITLPNTPVSAMPVPEPEPAPAARMATLPEDATTLQPLGDFTARRWLVPAIVVTLIVAAALLALWFSSDAEQETTPEGSQAPSLDPTQARDAASEMIWRSVRNAELDAAIRAKEAVLRQVDEPGGEPEQMEFDEEEAAPTVEPAPKAPAPKTTRRRHQPRRNTSKPVRKVTPAPAQRSAPEPSAPSKTDFEVQALDEI